MRKNLFFDSKMGGRLIHVVDLYTGKYGSLMIIQCFVLCSCYPGSVLEKAGGDEFKEEVKKLSESHGSLELAAG